MTTTTLKTDMGWGMMGVKADFANASDPVESLNYETGEWQPTQYQVANFQHSPQQALRQIIEDDLLESGFDIENYEEDIEDALNAAE